MDELNEVEIGADEQEVPPPPPSCQLHWEYLQGGQAADSGDALCSVADELHFACQGGAPFVLQYGDISAVQDRNVTVSLELTGGDTVVLSRMGRLHDSFLQALMDRWTEVNRKQALSQETLLAGFHGKAHNGEREALPCNIGIYRTAIVLDFADGYVARLPLVFTGRPDYADWIFRFRLPGEEWVASHLGRETDAFAAAVESAMAALEAEAANRLKALCPGLPSMTQRALAGLLLDGRAVALDAARARHGALADALVQSLAQVGLREEWDALSPLGLPEIARIGEKAGLQGGTYRFFFMPVVRGDRAAVVLEASSGGDISRATYVFRVEGGPPQLSATMDSFNYALVCVNFRREPIYLSNAQMGKPQYAHYARSVDRVPALALLRSSFLGRAAHGSPEGWLAGVNVLLDRM